MKSLALDRWDQESGDILLALGNDNVNAIFEGALRNDGKLDEVKPKPNAERYVGRWFRSLGGWIY